MQGLAGERMDHTLQRVAELERSFQENVKKSEQAFNFAQTSMQQILECRNQIALELAECKKGAELVQHLPELGMALQGEVFKQVTPFLARSDQFQLNLQTLEGRTGNLNERVLALEGKLQDVLLNLEAKDEALALCKRENNHLTAKVACLEKHVAHFQRMGRPPISLTQGLSQAGVRGGSRPGPPHQMCQLHPPALLLQVANWQGP